LLYYYYYYYYIHADLTSLLGQALLNQEIQTSGYVRGVATLDSELFVVCRGQSTVRVYDTTDFSETRQINVPGMNDPQDMIACKKDKCLYISDWSSESIQEFN